MIIVKKLSRLYLQQEETKLSTSPDWKKALKTIEYQPNNFEFGWRVAAWIGLLVIAFSLITINMYIAKITGIILAGLMFAHGVELQHQALHYTGFTRKQANKIIGVLMGLPLLVSFSSYQASHLRHHRYIGTRKNEEYFDYGDKYGSVISLSQWLIHLSLVMHYKSALVGIFNALFGRNYIGKSKRVSEAICVEYRLAFLVIVLLALISLYTGNTIIFDYWLFPMLFVAGPIHALIELPEHYGCAPLDSSAFINTRTITTNLFMSWFTNYNNYHVEHHLAPGLPLQRTKKLNQLIKEDKSFTFGSYAEFYRKLFMEAFDRN